MNQPIPLMLGMPLTGISQPQGRQASSQNGIRTWVACGQRNRPRPAPIHHVAVGVTRTDLGDLWPTPVLYLVVRRRQTVFSEIRKHPNCSKYVWALCSPANGLAGPCWPEPSGT
jgi:hypothetical protein